jgi:hypothetical protein
MRLHRVHSAHACSPRILFPSLCLTRFRVHPINYRRLQKLQIGKSLIRLIGGGRLERAITTNHSLYHPANNAVHIIDSQTGLDSYPATLDMRTTCS